MILKKYKNNLLTIIQESGIEPNLFIAEDGPIGKLDFFIISLRDSQIRFAVRPWEGSFENFTYCRSKFLTGFPISETLYSQDIDDLASRCNEWLNGVVKPYRDDVITPDLWQLLEETRSRTTSELRTPEDFDSFSDEEKTRIRLSLNEFRLLITQNFNPNQEELKTVDARLQYLSDAIDKHNKFDWKGIAISTAISITIALSLNPEQGNQLFQLFKQIFSNILYLLP